MGPALAFANKIITDMNGLKPSAWIIWQSIASYMSSVPVNGVVDGTRFPDFTRGFWGTAVADFDKEQIYLSKKYYVFGQFTKFITPKSYVIYTGNNNFLASYSPENKSVSVVCVNLEEKDKNCEFDLSSFVNGWEKVTAYRTSGMSLNEGENLAEVKIPVTEVSKGKFSSILIPNSVTTFVLSDVR